MTEVTDLAAAHQRRQQAIVSQTVAALAALWATIDSGDLDASWALVADRAAQLLALGQYQAANQSARYIQAQMAAQGVTEQLAGVVDARAFTGVAADGRPLGSLLSGGIYQAKAGIASGMSLNDAMSRGSAWLGLATTNEVAQAGRNADQVSVTAATRMHGYIRMVGPGACSRCVILAGKYFRWNQGFARHPHCKCVHVPVAEADGVADVRTSPRDYFASLSPAEQDATFGKANAEAIRDGADPGQVVNIYNRRRRADGEYAPNSGLYSFDFGGRTVQYTHEGANVTRGQFGKAIGQATGQTDQFQRRQNGQYPTPDQFELSRVRRLTPRSIYELAAGDRLQAIELLHRYGYIT